MDLMQPHLAPQGLHMQPLEQMPMQPVGLITQDLQTVQMPVQQFQFFATPMAETDEAPAAGDTAGDVACDTAVADTEKVEGETHAEEKAGEDVKTRAAKVGGSKKASKSKPWYQMMCS